MRRQRCLRPLEAFQGQQEDNKLQMENRLAGMHEGLREGFHKECVKVYRNVQQALKDENEKQTTLLDEKFAKLSGKTGKTMIFAMLGFVMGLAGLVLQILNLLHIL